MPAALRRQRLEVARGGDAMTRAATGAPDVIRVETAQALIS